MTERSEVISDRGSASEPGADGVRGRSPRASSTERSEVISDRGSASEPGADGVRGRSPRASMTDILVTQVKSGAHGKPKTRGTLRALGLGRIGKHNSLPDRPEIRGMIRRVSHLVTVDESPSTASTAGGE